MQGFWRRVALFLFFITLVGGFDLDEVSSDQDLGRNLEFAIAALASTSSGRELLERAHGFWKIPKEESLEQVFRWGEASRTDAVLTRHLNPKTGQEERDREVLVYLKEGQPQADLILDMAHELVHATSRPEWDPYDPQLTAAEYIRAGIEGPGGEVDAVYWECRVGLELGDRLGSAIDRCRTYRDSAAPGQPLLRQRVAEDFYRVGRWRVELSRRLGGDVAKFPLLSSDTPKLYSSTGHSPYPLALLREFEQITEIACANTRRRYEAFRDAKAAADRRPAGVLPEPPLRRATEQFLLARCQK